MASLLPQFCSTARAHSQSCQNQRHSIKSNGGVATEPEEFKMLILSGLLVKLPFTTYSASNKKHSLVENKVEASEKSERLNKIQVIYCSGSSSPVSS